MQLATRKTEAFSEKNVDARPTILFIPAFGDISEVYSPLLETELAKQYRLVTLDFPGFGGVPRLKDTETTLEALADVVHITSTKEQARIVVAHSLSSITASLAARREKSMINTIISLEGNLTPEDAYHSGTAANYENATEFRKGFLESLDSMVNDQPEIERYRAAVATADPDALWKLGRDAHKFSSSNIPGNVLSETQNVYYLYNPDNCPNATLSWLKRNPIKQILMEGATHWKSFDQPDFLAKKIIQALRSTN